MRFEVLGPVRIGSHTPSAAKLRAVLATLLVRANEVVSAESLIDELWGDDPPRTATTTLQVYISQLRKILATAEDGAAATAPETSTSTSTGTGTGTGTGTESRIVTRSPGYLIRVLPGELDLSRFESLHAQGRTAFEQHDFETAARLLHEALDLWKGPALSGVPQGTLLQAAGVHLAEWRMNALEQRVHADLKLGRHRELSGELMALAHEHPLHEGLHAHLMVALFRSDRQADALHVFSRIRRQLAEELGTEPGPALRRLHQRILRLDPALRLSGTGAPAVAAQPLGVPAGSTRPEPVVHLPRPTCNFTGREENLAAAEAMLRGETGVAAHPLAVVGKAGVGKTAFAVQLAHRAADAFPDGCVMVNFRDAEGRPLEPGEALLRLLRRLDAGRSHDTPPRQLPSSVDELGDTLQRRLFRRRLLLVLDDVVSEAQVRPILTATSSAVVITSRRMLAVDDMRQMTLDVLRPDEAESLLLATGGLGATEERPALARIAELCGYLPLALRVVGAGLASRPHWSPAALAARLDDERVRLSVLAIGDLDVRATLLVSYQEATPAEQRAFRLLGLAPAPDFALWSASALLGVPPAAAEQALEQLTQIHLLKARASSGSSTRYGLHDLLRVMARELLTAEDTASVRAATARLCTADLMLARHADSLLAPGRALPEMPTADPVNEDPAGTNGLHPQDVVRDAPLRWFQEEIAGLVAAVRQSHAAKLWSLTWKLADSLTGFFQASAAWADWAATTGLALDAARQAGNPAAEASVLRSQGDLAWQQRQVQQAATCYEMAMRQARQIGDQISEARAMIGLADITLDQGSIERARAMYAQGLMLCRAGDDLRGLTDALRGLALAELRRGRSDVALDRFTECRQAASRLGDRRWSEFARRSAESIRVEPVPGAAGSPSPVEVRPGVWLIDGTAA